MFQARPEWFPRYKQHFTPFLASNISDWGKCVTLTWTQREGESHQLTVMCALRDQQAEDSQLFWGFSSVLTADTAYLSGIQFCTVAL